VRLLILSSLGGIVTVRFALLVQLAKMVFDTSSGIIKIMRNEKYQAVSTARVTKTGCLIQFEYLHSKTAAKRNAMQISKTKTV